MNNPEIITTDLGNGYYQHQLSIATYYLSQTIISPVSLDKSRVLTNSVMKSQNDFGKFESYRLSQFVSADDLDKNKGEIVRLASVQEGRLIVNQKAIDIFNAYNSNQISFVGNYGKVNSGKSFWYDKILNLSEVDGNNYSSIPRQPGLYFWSIPYTKGNLKFFLIDFVGLEGSDKISADQQKLLDFELLLSEKLIIVPEPDDQQLKILKPAYKDLMQSQKRFTERGIQANKFSTYWPNEIYVLYRSAKPVRKEIDNIGILFSVYNFSILHDALDPSKSNNKEDLLKSSIIAGRPQSDALNQKYVKMTSVVFKDIYEKMSGKQYGKVAFNGKNLAFIMQQSRSAINKGSIPMDHIMNGVKGDIYDETISKCKNIYLQEVDSIRNSKDPLPIDVLTSAFEKADRKAMKEFDTQIVDPQIHSKYEQKLRSEIDNIEADILRDNGAKTHSFYDDKLPISNSSNNNDYFNSLKSGFQKQKSLTALDQNDTIPVAKRLQHSLINSDSGIVLLPRNQRTKEIQLKQLIAQKKNYLNSLRINQDQQLAAGHHSNQQISLVNQHQALTRKADTLRTQIERSILPKDLTPAQKQAQLERLRVTHLKNIEALSQLKNSKQHPKAAQLAQKISQINGKASQIKSGINNFDNSYLASKSTRSVIRDIQGQNIKKVIKK